MDFICRQCVRVLGILAVAATLARADQVVVDNLTGAGETCWRSDAGYHSTDNRFINSSTLQRFDAPIGGPVSQVTARAWKFPDPHPEPLKVSILATNGGLPGPLLGTIIVPEAALPRGNGEIEVVFDFAPAHAQLEAGKSYYVAFWTDTPGDLIRFSVKHVWAPGRLLGYEPLAGYDRFQGGYLGGGPSSADSGAEIGLRVSVVPEPATLAAGGLALLRRRKPEIGRIR
jgi:hypothetical protein